MRTPHDQRIVDSRIKWVAAACELEKARELVCKEINRLDKDLSAEQKACSFCHRPHSSQMITAITKAENGSSICDLCVDTLAGVSADV